MAPCVCGTEAEEEEKREDRVAEERMRDRQVWNLRGGLHNAEL